MAYSDGEAKGIVAVIEMKKRIAALENEIIALKAETRHGMYSKSRYDQCLSNLLSELERTGYQPNGLQMKYREKPAPDIDWQELEWAVCDALLHQGTIIAWPGDGVSCVAQMIAGQAERAETAEAERDRLREAIGKHIQSGTCGSSQNLKAALAAKGNPTKTVVGTAESSTCPNCTAPHFVTDTAICVNCGGPIKVAAKGE